MGHDLAYAALALLATIAYYVAFLVFRISAQRMPPLRGSRPFFVAWQMLTSPIWFAGGLILFVGLAYEVVAFTAMPLAVAQPIFAISLVFLVLYSVWFLDERLSVREWVSVAMFVLATVMIGLSAGSERDLTADDTLVGTLVSPWKMLAVMAPALVVSAVVWLLGDRRRGGRHARKLAGVAYGIGAGACAGLAEAGIRGISIVYEDTGSVTAVLKSPYPLLTLGMAAIALGGLQVALQRCRLAIVATVLTVIGRTYLVLSSSVLFGEQWPEETLPFTLRTAGFTLALLALVTFPRYEQPDTTEATVAARAARRAAQGPDQADMRAIT
ncbi:DMT family transporter [Spirillospora sp. NPDC047279]|uniref:DMT family transporter n=1 Tax=Spirillospora sp. NPDC047279 TaxID=3155478 RepID=UPI0033D570BE